MRVLIFGGSGYVGRHILARLVADGHHVEALSRSAASGAIIARHGGVPCPGAIEDEASWIGHLDRQDAVIWAPQLLLDAEQHAVRRLLGLLSGSERTFVFTSGTSVLSEPTGGAWSETVYGEDDAFVPRRQLALRVATENMVRDAGHGLRTICIRPPIIWGHGGCKIIAELYHSARRTGAVCHVGPGLNVYTNVHVDDVADLYSRALNAGTSGALYHCVGGEASFRALAERIARHLDLGTRSVTVPEASEIWDPFSAPVIFASSTRTRAIRARRELGWRPHPDRRDILEECVHPAYADAGERTLPAYLGRGADGSVAASRHDISTGRAP